MYKRYGESGSQPDNERPGHAVAILRVQEGLPGIQIVDVNTDYQRLWGGSRKEWLGASPTVVEQESANQQIIEELCEELNGHLHNGFEGIGGREVSRCHYGSCRHIEWRITAMGPLCNGAMTLVLTQRDVTEQIEKEILPGDSARPYQHQSLGNYDRSPSMVCVCG